MPTGHVRVSGSAQDGGSTETVAAARRGTGTAPGPNRLVSGIGDPGRRATGRALDDSLCRPVVVKVSEGGMMIKINTKCLTKKIFAL